MVMFPYGITVEKNYRDQQFPLTRNILLVILLTARQRILMWLIRRIWLSRLVVVDIFLSHSTAPRRVRIMWESILDSRLF